MSAKVRVKNKFYCFTCREVPYSSRNHWRSLSAHINPEQTVLQALKEMEFPVNENDITKYSYCCSQCVSVMKSYTIHMKYIQRYGDLWKQKTGRDPPYPLRDSPSLEMLPDEMVPEPEAPAIEINTTPSRGFAHMSSPVSSPGVQRKVPRKFPKKVYPPAVKKEVPLFTEVEVEAATGTVPGVQSPRFGPAFVANAGGVKRNAEEALQARAGLDHPYSMKDATSTDGAGDNKPGTVSLPQHPGVQKMVGGVQRTTAVAKVAPTRPAVRPEGSARARLSLGSNARTYMSSSSSAAAATSVVRRSGIGTLEKWPGYRSSSTCKVKPEPGTLIGIGITEDGKKEREPRETWKTRCYKNLEMSKYPILYSGLWNKSTKAKTTMVDHIVRCVSKEMRAAEKTESEETDVKTCTYFSWEYQLEKYRAFMPITCRILGAVLSGTKRPSRDQKKHETQRLVLMLAIALFHRKPGKFKLVQSSIGLKLWKGGADRKVLTYLRGFGVTQSALSAARMQVKSREMLARELVKESSKRRKVSESSSSSDDDEEEEDDDDDDGDDDEDETDGDEDKSESEEESESELEDSD